MDFFSIEQVEKHMELNCKHDFCVDVIISHSDINSLHTLKQVPADVCSRYFEPHHVFAHLWLFCENQSNLYSNNLRELGYLPCLDLFDTTSLPIKIKHNIQINRLWKHLFRPVHIDQFEHYVHNVNPMIEIDANRYKLLNIWALRLEIDKALIKHNIKELGDEALSMLVLETELDIMNDRISFWMSMLAAMERVEMAGVETLEKWFYSCEQRIFEFRQQFHVNYQSSRIASQFGELRLVTQVFDHFNLDTNTQQALLYMVQKTQTPFVLVGELKKLLFLVDPKMDLVVYDGLLFIACRSHSFLFSYLFHRHMKVLWSEYVPVLKPLSQYLERRQNFDCFDAGGRLTDHFSDILEIETGLIEANRNNLQNYGYKAKKFGTFFDSKELSYNDASFTFEEIETCAPECMKQMLYQAKKPTQKQHNTYKQRLLLGRFIEMCGKTYDEFKEYIAPNKNNPDSQPRFFLDSMSQAKAAFGPDYKRMSISCRYIVDNKWCPKLRMQNGKTPQQNCSHELHSRFNFNPDKQKSSQVLQPKWYLLQATKARKLTRQTTIQYTK